MRTTDTGRTGRRSHEGRALQPPGLRLHRDNWPLLKPLAWQGDITIGAARGRATFQGLDANPRWTGLMDGDAAGVAAVEAYLSVYGPATAEHVRYWLGGGLGAARNRLNRWIASVGDRITEIDVEGERCLTLTEHLHDLVAISPTSTVRLLPAADQWVMGPGRPVQRHGRSSRDTCRPTSGRHTWSEHRSYLASWPERGR